MPASTMTSKGQITMPKAVRQSLGLHTGDRVDFIPMDGGGFRLVVLRKDVSSLRGRFAGRVASPMTLAQMAQAVELEAAARDMRVASAPAQRRQSKVR